MNENQTPPEAQPTQPAQNAPYDMQNMIPTKNKPALLSYYFGVFGLLPFVGFPFAITAIILAKKGLKQFAENPTPGAKIHAQVGLYLGYFELTVLALFIATVVYFINT